MSGSRRLTAAVTALSAGDPVLVVDDCSSIGTGCLLLPGQSVSTAAVASLVRHSSGFVLVAMTESDCTRLAIPPMNGERPHGDTPDFRVSVDADDGVTTGISAADRARTIRTLADPDTTPHQLTRPGHVVPSVAAPGGLLGRNGFAEVAIDLAGIAGIRPTIAYASIVSVAEPTGLADAAELADFAAVQAIPLLSFSDIIAHRLGRGGLVRLVDEAVLTHHDVRVHAYVFESRYERIRHTVIVPDHPDSVRATARTDRIGLMSSAVQRAVLSEILAETVPEAHSAAS